MIRKWFIVLFLLFFVVPVAHSQDAAPPEPSRAAEEQSEIEKQIKDQAVFLLRNNLLRSKSIDNIRQRAEIVAEASVTLWDYDQPFAENSLLGFINQSLTEYKELLVKEKRTADETKSMQNLDFALKKSLRALARKDLRAADLLQNKFFEIRQESLKGKNPDDSLELAAEGLDLDEQRTLAMLSAIIQQGIPSQFPLLVSDLSKKNPQIAEILIQRAIQNLATNPNYTAADAVYISVVVFSEQQALIPILNNENNPNVFGILAINSGTSNSPAIGESVSNYFNSVQSFFNSRLLNQALGFFDSPKNLIQSFFLIEKMRAYDRTFGFNQAESLTRIFVAISSSMHTAQFSQQTLSDISGYAFRLAAANNPLQLDDGTGLLEKAENAKTPEERLDYLVRAVIQFIEFREFAKAESIIFDIQNSEIRDALYTLVNQRAAFDAIEKRNWNEFEKRTEKIADKSIKAFHYLKALAVFASEHRADSLTVEFTAKAEKYIPDIPDKTAKASAYVYLTSLLFSIDPSEGIRTLPLSMKSINDAADYNEDRFRISIDLPTPKLTFAEFIGGDAFRKLFSNLAETDWIDSQVQANGIKASALQAIAQVVTAQTVLSKKH